MMEGKALIIAGVEEDIDPMLTPVLEKQVVIRCIAGVCACATAGKGGVPNTLLLLSCLLVLQNIR